MTGQSATPFKGQVSEELVRELVFATNTKEHEEFKRQHGAIIERAVKGIAAAHDALDLLRLRLKGKGDIQIAFIEAFSHSAINSVLCATHHLVSGYPIAAGNLLRHYIEAVAMILLCLDDSSGVVQRLESDMMSFPVHTAPSMLQNKKRRKALERLIDFRPDAWEQVLDLKGDVYDPLSHASALSLAYEALLSTEHASILGGEYDHAKTDAYAKELSRCATSAESLEQLIVVTGAALVKAKGA
jgi:hypothetical protein